MMNEKMVEWVHFDLRHWPAQQSLDMEIQTDTFSPNTLSHLRKLLSADKRAQELIAKAETAEWSTEIADELFSHLTTWLQKHYPKKD